MDIEDYDGLPGARFARLRDLSYKSLMNLFSVSVF
jgi:hypothetical protein